ncbi:MAG TPA: right-handed parallel beta-helix repeat-containing protein, partial [Pyrinomonadaceae bacterium]
TFVRNTVISNCSAGGVSIAPTGGTARANLEDVHSFSGTNGFRAVGSAIVTARECSATGHGNAGFQADGASARFNLRNCMSSNNGDGVESNNGAILRISNCVISDNILSGVAKGGAPLGIVESFQNNENKNTTPGTASPATPF